MPDRAVEHLQSDFRKRVLLLLNDCRAEKLPVVIVETLRSYERSNELYAQGRTTPGQIVTKAKAGQSYHNFGLAIDMVLLDDGQPTWDFDPAGKVWSRVVWLAKNRGLAWGGDWRGFVDTPHFQPKVVPPLLLCRVKWPGGWTP